LAGSERIRQTGSEGLRQKEGISINKSLLNLGIVISALSENERSVVHEICLFHLAVSPLESVVENLFVFVRHVPFRDSKLTRILSSSLGGNARTAIICCASPALSNVEHTINCLRFGSRAVKIKQHAQVNEVAEDKTMIFQHESKIKELRARLEAGGSVDEESDEDLTPEEKKKKAEERKAREIAEERQKKMLDREMQLKLQHLTNLILVSTSSGPSGIPSGKKKRRASFSHMPSDYYTSRNQQITTLFGGETKTSAIEEASSAQAKRGRSDFGADKLTTEQDLFFRVEQYKRKTEQMDQLLKELCTYFLFPILVRCLLVLHVSLYFFSATENSELLKQVADQVQQLEDFTSKNSEQGTEITTLRADKQKLEQQA